MGMETASKATAGRQRPTSASISWSRYAGSVSGVISTGTFSPERSSSFRPMISLPPELLASADTSFAASPLQSRTNWQPASVSRTQLRRHALGLEATRAAHGGSTLRVTQIALQRLAATAGGADEGLERRGGLFLGCPGRADRVTPLLK